MSTLGSSPEEFGTALSLQDLANRFGPMSSKRVRFEPAPGTATEVDLVRILDTEDRLYELVDGTLVEKTLGFEESELTAWLIGALTHFIGPRKLGAVTGSDGPYRLRLRLVPMPDVAFVAKSRFPEGKRPRDKVAKVVPNLAVKVFSEGNTPAEMRAKLEEYFRAGVEIIWIIDHRQRTCEVFTSPADRLVLTEQETLTGGTVLPGFDLSLQELFSRLDDG